jgi:hypothetical protein
LLARRLGAEFVGTALLLIAVVGSGIAAQRLRPNDIGLELLENSIATGAALAAIILAVGPVSDAHLNPALPSVSVGSLLRTEQVIVKRTTGRPRRSECQCPRGRLRAPLRFWSVASTTPGSVQ